ncbi:hypothetical protein PI124_g17516 [Phytophthora idaei]|nr:hypothetical protein PI125_g18929 [Phytophthora idaei]KAG3139352.1 hypothetical protein PI126_g16493 [Phytophthora idaei]KAG3237505.1 hypothetical protein PI124_g17516 [Phytophthora idaei]
METTHPPKKRKTQTLPRALHPSPSRVQDEDGQECSCQWHRRRAHTERDDLLANVLELAEEAETARDEKTQEKEAKQRDDERADAMHDEAMTGMRGRNNKHDTFIELMAHIKERDEFARALELRKVANEENRLALERDRLAIEKEKRMALIEVMRAITIRLPQ